VEFCYKNDELGDPMVNNYHILAMKLANEEEINALTQQALRLIRFCRSSCLVKTSFSWTLSWNCRTDEGDIVLADEISPDTCRFWDSATMEKAGQR